jgi:LCP family protein required for cell wall assembly
VRRVVAAALVLAALAVSAIGGLMLGGRRAGAQSPTPPVQLRRVQHADYVAPPDGKRPIFILAIGSDARPGVCMPVERCLADSLHLIGINPQKRAATILGFPRDAHVPVPGFGSQKINNALFHGGPELVVRTVEELTGITIDYYMLASFADVVRMVEELGGLEVDVPYSMNDPASGAVFDAGTQVLTGKETLAFSRNRKDTPEGDVSRSENQGLVLLAALRKLRQDFSDDPTALFRWITVGSAHLQTDLTFAEVFDLLMAGLSIDPDDVTNLVAPGDLGFVGEASVVFLTEEADRIYDDMRKDGLAG